MLIRLQPSPSVTQLIGYCNDTSPSDGFVTEFYPYGSADGLLDLLRTDVQLRQRDGASLRLRLCIDYVEILSLLHSDVGPVGTRILCDSNDLMKTLEQFLVTSDLRLNINDLDALPEVVVGENSHRSTVKCGHREIFGDFAAPEQLWPFDDKEFDDRLMPGYDQKTDIWKIPDVCGYFLSDRPDCRSIVYRLVKIHNRCKSLDPNLRPTAKEVLDNYRAVWTDLGFS